MKKKLKRLKKKHYDVSEDAWLELEREEKRNSKFKQDFDI